MNNEIIEKIRHFVEEECKRPSSKYGEEPFLFHFLPVVEYSKKLSKIFPESDEEILEISAWLHDIGSIVYGRKDHHLTGANIAEEKLRELGYLEEKISLVKKCILNHRGSIKNHRESIEEKILAEADALSNFENIPGLFKAAFLFENQTQGEAKKSVLLKLQNCYDKLSSESQQLIKSKYDAVNLLLK